MQNNNTETLLAHAGHYLDTTTGAIIPPISLTTTYARDEHYALRDSALGYQRNNATTNVHVESLLAQLEGGTQAQLFSSGLAAATSLFSCLSPGDHVVLPKVCYYALRNWVIEFTGRWGLSIGWYDAHNIDSLEQAVSAGKTRLVWVETPANPSWDITDIAAAADIAHRVGALLATDSTVSTPIITRPIEHGADFVVHSATKYLNGHSDVLAGAVIARADSDYWQQIKSHRTHAGAVLGPFEAWLLQRGMRTLHLRVARASESAMAIAQTLQQHPAVECVHYPGLASHPGHTTAQRQMENGFGGMLSVLLRGGEAAALRVAKATRLFLPATSLGGVESLIEHRASVEAEGSPVAKNLLRLSIGVEYTGDLIDDLQQALD